MELYSKLCSHLSRYTEAMREKSLASRPKEVVSLMRVGEPGSPADRRVFQQVYPADTRLANPLFRQLRFAHAR